MVKVFEIIVDIIGIFFLSIIAAGLVFTLTPFTQFCFMMCLIIHTFKSGFDLCKIIFETESE